MDILSSHYPQLADNLPAVDYEKVRPVFKYDISKTEQDLSIQFTPLEKTCVETIDHLLHLQKTLAGTAF